MPFPPPTQENILMERFLKIMPQGIRWSITAPDGGGYIAVCEGGEYRTAHFILAVKWIAQQAGILDLLY